MRMTAGSRRFEVGPRENDFTMAPGKVAPFVAAAIAWIASGCGGGGGGGGDPNAAPVIGAAAFSTDEDTALTGQLTATDADGDSVTFAKSSDPSSGTVTVSSAGAFVYTPNANANGNDSFGVRVTDARGSSVTSMVSVSIAAVNDAPAAVNDVLRVDGAGLATINVKANDSDAEGEAITVAITLNSDVGTATVNADGTVRIAGLPPRFKGVTRFKYSAADPSGASNTVSAAVFVGTDPFRVVFAGDESANGQPELFMTDFVATFRISSATDGNLRLRGFAAADNGSTVAYTRRDSTNTNALDLSFVRTDAIGNQVRIAMPNGYSIQPGADQYVVSRDGQWIAFLAKTDTPATKITPFLLSVANPTAIQNVSPSTTSVSASQLKFSFDSSYLYFLASEPGGDRRTLYRTQVSSNTPANAVSAVATSADNSVSAYQVARDQSRIGIAATRNGTLGVYTIDPTNPGAETLLSTDLNLGETIESTTLSKPPGLGTPNDGTRVAYTGSFAFDSAHVVSISEPGGPTLVAPYAAVGLGPNGDTLLYTRPGASFPFPTQVYEAILANGTPGDPVGNGVDAVYDSEQDTLILTQQTGSNKVLTAAYRENFGSTTQLGMPGQVARFFGLSGAARAVALIGEGASSGSVTSTHLALFNARAPAVPLFLGAFNSPLDFNSDLATVVTY